MIGKVLAHLQHYALMMAVDFRPRGWVKTWSLSVAILFYLYIITVGTLDWLKDVERGEVALWPGILLAMVIIPIALEMTLIVCLQVLAGQFAGIRRRLFAQMMTLRRHHPFLNRLAGERAVVLRALGYRALEGNAFLGLFLTAFVIFAGGVRLFG